MTEESCADVKALTLKGRGRGWDGAATVVVAGAGAVVTWSAGRASGTVCSVGRIVVDIFPTPKNFTPR